MLCVIFFGPVNLFNMLSFYLIDSDSVKVVKSVVD